MKIIKFEKLNNFGVFQNFDWDSSLSFQNKEGKNCTYDFNTINILYGRNYSGKTSLSKIIRSFQTKQLPVNYGYCDFSIAIEANDQTISLSQDNLTQFTHSILVYNTDFVKEHLGFIVDDSKDIEAFTVTLGEENLDALSHIQQIHDELGSDALGFETGLFSKKVDAEKEVETLRLNAIQKKDNLKNDLSKKAADIKNNTSHFNRVNYNKINLETDIRKILDLTNYVSLSLDEVGQYHKTIISEPMDDPPYISTTVSSLIPLMNSTRELCQVEVGQADKIAELVEQPNLNQWVETGLSLHQNRNACAFCNGPLSIERVNALRKHFDDEMKNLQVQITRVLHKVEAQKKQLDDMIHIDAKDYYKTLLPMLQQGINQLAVYVAQQQQTLQILTEYLNKKLQNVFQCIQLPEAHDFQNDIENCLKAINEIRNQHCAYSVDMIKHKKSAQEKLRIQEVYAFCRQICYSHRVGELNTSQKQLEMKQQYLEKLEQDIKSKEQDITHWEKQLKNEAAACEKINAILTHEFGHPHLSLQAIEKDELGSQSIKFEILRDDQKAHNLSEGEQTLISFCYFLVNVEEAINKDLTPIIWIDDPICSLDSNHIFFIYSLIKHRIYDTGKYKQLFISTHNLDFLKYLRRLDKKEKVDKFKNFLIERLNQNSHIRQMPNYLTRYATEFNYLFEQIYKCAEMAQIDDANYHQIYNFDNNARKFLEIYSFYKFPNSGMSDSEKLKKFWGDELHRVFVDRVNNEYSHLNGVLERGGVIVDVPEMQKVARLILKTIEDADQDQFDALKQSISI